jgi:hypothetical protein
MASQQKLGLRAKRWSGIDRADHRRPAVDEPDLIDRQRCVEVLLGAGEVMDNAFNEASREL